MEIATGFLFGGAAHLSAAAARSAIAPLLVPSGVTCGSAGRGAGRDPRDRRGGDRMEGRRLDLSGRRGGLHLPPGSVHGMAGRAAGRPDVAATPSSHGPDSLISNTACGDAIPASTALSWVGARTVDTVRTTGYTIGTPVGVAAAMRPYP